MNAQLEKARLRATLISEPPMAVSNRHTEGGDSAIHLLTKRFRLGTATIVIGGGAEIGQIKELLCRIIRLVPDDNQSDEILPSDLLWYFEPAAASLTVPETVGEETATGDLKGKQTATGYFWWCGASSLNVSLDDRRVVVQIKDDFWNYSLYQQRQFFLMAFYMLLRKQEQYGLHANGVVHNDHAYLIAGHSGSGKSTLALSLTLQGWFFWGDDTIMLRQIHDNQVSGTALRRGSSCSARTAAMSAPAESMYRTAPCLQDDKRLIDVESLKGVTVVQEARPDVLIFPTITTTKESCLTPMPQTQAMAHLIATSTGILTNRHEVQTQMNVLEKLTRQTRAFSFTLGTDVFESPASVAAMLADGAAGTSWHG